MTVQELMQILKTLEPDAVIDMSKDEEGNAFGDIHPSLAKLKLKDGRRVYTLYPSNQQMFEQRYQG